MLIIGMVALFWGCGTGPRQMMPTPNVYLNEAPDPYHALHPDLKSTEVRLFYVTDRAPEQDEEGNLRYGYSRSASLAFGDAVVDLGDNITWEDLLEASRTQERLKPVELTLGKITEHIRGPKTPFPYTMVDGKIVEEPSWVEQSAQAADAFRKELVQQLALTPCKEIFIYIHGFHNTFDDAAFAMAELWHFIGRIGVPMIYTWPAGYPGLFGYTYDRESSEFTVYTSPDDKAIGFAMKLFQSPRGRVGTYGPNAVDDHLRAGLEFGKDNYSVVMFAGASGGFVYEGDKYGHSYFRNDPSVSSDVVLMLRDDLDPGTPERPLERIDLNFWKMPPGYPGGLQKE